MRRIATLLLGLTTFAVAAAHAQSAGRAVAVVPFGVGERADYQVKLGAFGVGESRLEVAKLDTIRGVTTYHLKFNLKGGIPLARVDDRYQSWLDVHRLASLRFDQNQSEVKYKRHRIFDFYPEQRRWVRPDRKDRESEQMTTDLPLDDVSFIFFVRTLPLKVGETYTYSRYFKADGNPVTIKVLRTETIKVPAGTFKTVVVQPVIQTDGLFSQGGKAELYFSDDARRVLVMLRSDVPSFPGTLTLHLKSFRAGTPLSSRDRADAS